MCVAQTQRERAPGTLWTAARTRSGAAPTVFAHGERPAWEERLSQRPHTQLHTVTNTANTVDTSKHKTRITKSNNGATGALAHHRRSDRARRDCLQLQSTTTAFSRSMKRLVARPSNTSNTRRSSARWSDGVISLCCTATYRARSCVRAHSAL